jgi:hypothetical protein
MVMFGPEHGRGLRRLVIAALSGWLVSWLGVAVLITLSVAWPHNPIPRVLLAAWAVLVAVSFVIPGASLGAIRGRGPVVVLAAPFVPFARAALAVWPHLPETVQDFLEGNFRRHRWARLQRRQAR